MLEDQIKIKTPEYVSLKFSLAGVGSRAAAFMIDQLVIILVNILVFIGLFFLLQSNTFSIVESFGMFIAGAIIVVFVLDIGYFLLLEFFWGGKTVGKHIVGLRTIQDNGHPVTLLACIIRNLLRIIDMLPSGYLLGMLLVFFHSEHKRLGDIAGGTIVVHESPGIRKKRKKNTIEKVIEERGWSKETIVFEEWQIKAINQKDWELLRLFAQRFSDVTIDQKNELTKKVASIIFPKIGLTVDAYHISEVEKRLLIFYLYSKDEWEFIL